MDTSWNKVAKWYDDLVENDNSYQKEVILPNLLRLMQIKPGQRILDLACGQGLFSREFSNLKAKVYACDISEKLVELAKSKNSEVEYFVHSAEDVLPDSVADFDAITIVSGIQNISNLDKVFKVCSKSLKVGGRLFVVMNHPAFRIPKASSWGYDEKLGIQYRRIDRYLSEASVKIDMTPGRKVDKEYTVSFHRPLQSYFSSLNKSGLSVVNLEEWFSNRKSQKGPKQKAEDYSRKEIPLFLTIIAKK